MDSGSKYKVSPLCFAQEPQRERREPQVSPSDLSTRPVGQAGRRFQAIPRPIIQPHRPSVYRQAVSVYPGRGIVLTTWKELKERRLKAAPLECPGCGPGGELWTPPTNPRIAA